MVLLFCTILFKSLVPIDTDAGKHDFHLSKSEIFYNRSNQSLEVSLHLFIDDLEAGIQNAGMNNPYISTTKELDAADSLISVYLDQHFSILVDGHRVEFNFLGKEDSNDLIAIWCYLEGENVINPKRVTLQNNLLTEIFADQKNIVAFKSDTKQEFLLFDLKKQEATIDL